MNKAQTNPVFSGQRRVFFLILAFAFLAQAVLFFANRAQTAMDLLNDDFKIAVVLNNATAGEAAAFKTALAALPGVSKARVIDPQQTIDSLKKPGMQALSPDLLPRFYELSVDNEVMLNPSTWVQNNIARMPSDAAAYYKEGHAKLAVYLNAISRLANILLICCAFALISFGFFVEAFYAPAISGSVRAGGVLAAVFAFALAGGIAYILAAPLNKIYPAYQYDMLGWQQAALFTACLLAGWTLAKWKRF